jgi:ribonuclease HI
MQDQSLSLCIKKHIYIGVVGAGVNLHDTRGNKIVHHSWGLGKVSNNLAETYAFWCGLSITKGGGIRSSIILGDTMFVIK